MAARTADHHDDGQRDKGEHDADHSDDVTDTATDTDDVTDTDSKVSVQGTGRNEAAAPR